MRSPCPSSTPRLSPRQASALLPPPSCSALDCGGSTALKAPRAAPAKDTANTSQSTSRLRNSQHASAPPLRANSTPAEIPHGRHAAGAPSVLVALLPLIVVILVN